MTRYIAVIIAVLGLGAAIVVAKNKWTEKDTEFKREKAFAKLRGDYLERVAWVRTNPDPTTYKNEVTTFFSWYFKRVNEQLNEFGGNRKFDDYLVELDRKASAKGDSDSDSKGDRTNDKKAMFDYTMKAFESFKSGNYSPYWTGTDKGIRLDILSASTEMVNGESKIHMPVVVWGLPREEREDDRKVRRVVTSGNFRFNWKLFDEKQKLIAEIPGEGGPDNRVDWPDRYIKYFPPMMVLGHYNVDKVPQEAKTVEITFSISARSPSGGDINANYAWKLDVPAEWKLGAGEQWKGAQDSIRPEEEINAAVTKKK